MVRAEALPEARPARRCWVYVGNNEDYEEEVVAVRVGDVYVVGTVLDDWYAVPAHAVRRLLAKLLNAREEDISLSC
jgi:hypothetical protein